MTDSDEVCWICLDSCNSPSKPVVAMPCKCPRRAHRSCLARWQLQSAGTRREKHCEFCDEELPDWKNVLNDEVAAVPGEKKVLTFMRVHYLGFTKTFEVTPGPEGRKKFNQDVKREFGFDHEISFDNMSFMCDEPTADSEDSSVMLNGGTDSFDAAVLCSSIAAARQAAATRKESEVATAPSRRLSFGDKIRSTLSQLVSVSI